MTHDCFRPRMKRVFAVHHSSAVSHMFLCCVPFLAICYRKPLQNFLSGKPRGFGHPTMNLVARATSLLMNETAVSVNHLLPNIT